MCHASKLTNLLLPLPPLQLLCPRFRHPPFQSSPPCSSRFAPPRYLLLFSTLPSFEAPQPVPPSSSPPIGESSFVSCRISKLTNPLLPLPPLQQVSPRL